MGAWFLHFTFIFVQHPSTSAFWRLTLRNYSLLNFVYETCRPFTQKLLSYHILWHIVILYLFFVKFRVQVPELIWQVLVILQVNQNPFFKLLSQMLLSSLLSVDLMYISNLLTEFLCKRSQYTSGKYWIHCGMHQLMYWYTHLLLSGSYIQFTGTKPGT